MNLPFFPLRDSIGGRMLRAFAAMAVLIAALGLYAALMLSMAGDIVKDTYDRPLMAINYARAASLDFLQMEKELLRAETMPDARPAIDRHIEELTRSFYDDLSVAEERSLAPAERSEIAAIRDLVTQWVEGRRLAVSPRRDPQATVVPDPARANATLDQLAATIIDHFDTLIELAADHGFIERRRALGSIATFQNTTVAVSLLGLLAAAVITWRLRRRIVKPLTAAADVANQIAGGELQTPIPAGGSDETGALLRSMTVMQENIRRMVERETAERQSAQRRMVEAIESAQEGMVLVDAGGRVALGNSRMTTLFPAFAQHSIAGSDFAGFVQLARAQLAQAADGNAFAAGGEVKLADGRWIRISRSATQDGGFFLLFSDISDIKEREERLKEAKLQAEAASRAKSRFLANMSHELRTPLNAIIGFSEVIAGQILGPGATDRYAGYAANILDSGRHLLGVINNILDLAKTEAGTLELIREPIDLCQILDRCAAIIEPRCAAAGLRFDLALPDDPLIVDADAAKLQQALLNLLSNAAKFTAAGGAVSLRAAWQGEAICIEIADTGIGMAAEEISLALTPFEQVDARLARSYEGGGLGLPLAKALIELHGGALAIASTPGAGTTVTVILQPLEQGPSLQRVASR